ncbi:hypothetical protein [Mucilaginibacter panaciglaebae]|uniref:Uncharacterized protein n=1 Tax=Mucilaginibacter panaciglaebae TaxID=502331 RepID=A0ABP7WNV9_9SPHI
MDVNLYLILGAIAIVAIIFINHRNQKRKVKTMLEDAGGTQLIFLTKAVEKKYKALAEILYEGGMEPVGPNTGTTQRDILVQQLQKLEHAYAAKKISLRTYDDHLFTLLEKANKLTVVA